MTTVISVRFPTSGRVYFFSPGEHEIHEGDAVIVETARGTEFGEVTQLPHEVPDEVVVQPLKEIIRVATDEDRKMREEYSAKENEAFEICRKKIEKHELDMKLVGAEYAFDGSKVIFFFTADERVDFRELVRDLASEFRTRIELRQIGVRDEARMLGGLGPCGRPVCCNSFLDGFQPVSIKMAKEQNLSLSPTKISGLCGRLMCCLQYEEAAYEEIKKKMPKVGKEIRTPDGIGRVVENNAITEKTKVHLMMEDESVEVREYHYSLLCAPNQTPSPVPEEKMLSEEETETPKGSVEYVPPEPAVPVEQPAEPEKKKRPSRRSRRGGRNGQKQETKPNQENAPVVDKKAGETSPEGKAQFSRKARFNRRRGRGSGGKPSGNAPGKTE